MHLHKGTLTIEKDKRLIAYLEQLKPDDRKGSAEDHPAIAALGYAVPALDTFKHKP